MDNPQYKRIIDWLPNSPGYIIGREDYRNSVVLAPFVQFGGELNLIFEKRAATIPQGDEICFPGGGAHPEDLSLVETAVRETWEELGISRERITVGGHLGTLMAALGAVVDVFIGCIEAEGPEAFRPNTAEVSRLLFIPFSRFLSAEPERYSLDIEVRSIRKNPDGTKEVLLPARELGLPERYWHKWPGRASSLYVYRFHGEVIWGMTARMVREIVKIWENSHGAE